MRKVFVLPALLTAIAAIGRADADATQPATAPAMRRLRYTSRPPEQAVAWQKQVRAELARVLQIHDLYHQRGPLHAKTLSKDKAPGYDIHELEFQSTPGRRIKAIITYPAARTAPCPAVVCIHGHGGNRRIVYDRSTIYKGFAAELLKSIERSGFDSMMPQPILRVDGPELILNIERHGRMVTRRYHGRDEWEDPDKLHPNATPSAEQVRHLIKTWREIRQAIDTLKPAQMMPYTGPFKGPVVRDDH